MKTKIVVVDDEIGICKLCEKVLTNTGYQVYTFNNGEDALNLLKTQFCDLLLTDFQMPDMNGITLINEVKTISLNTKIVIMTACTDIEMILNNKNLKHTKYLIKPFEIYDLTQTIKSCLNIIPAPHVIPVKTGI